VPKLPVISGKKAISALLKLGFIIKRQKGDHVILNKERINFTVPLHKTLKKGTLKAILRQAQIDLEEFLEKL